jgi:hypothetical protein
VSALLACASALQRYDAGVTCNPERREMCSDRVGDVAWGKVRIVLLGHSRVSMAKLLSDDAHRYAAHSQHRAVRVAQHVLTSRIRRNW